MKKEQSENKNMLLEIKWMISQIKKLIESLKNKAQVLSKR